LFWHNTSQERDRRERVFEVIRELDADVVAVQELRPRNPDLAGARLAELAKETGLTSYRADSDQVAIAGAPHGFYVGLLWNPNTVTPVPDTFYDYDEGDFWHGMISGVFTVSGDDGLKYQVNHSSYHATPVGNSSRRASEAERVALSLIRPDNHPPGLIGADWNSVSADRVPIGETDSPDETGHWVYYDEDPYTNLPWRSDFIFQCEWDYSENGRRSSWRANRAPSEILYSAGIVDAASTLHAASFTADQNEKKEIPRHITTGYWPVDDPLPPRRFDTIRVTNEVAPALCGYEVFDNPLSRSASDHLPVVVTYDPAKIQRN